MNTQLLTDKQFLEEIDCRRARIRASQQLSEAIVHAHQTGAITFETARAMQLLFQGMPSTRE